MGYKWLPVTEDFDKSLVIKKWRFDVSIPIFGIYDGALAELPNIDIKTCWNNSQPSNGYAFSNRFNLGTKYFSSRYYGWTDRYWTATTQAHTTLVSGTTYEFECPVDLYWAGNYSTPWNPNIPNYMWFYVNATTFETDVTAITASYSSTTCAVTLTAEEDMAWTASTLNDWISISPSQGTGSSVFIVTVAKNTAYSGRNGSVSVTNGEDTIEITVEQAKYPLFVPSENIYRADLEVIKGYRSGNTINKAYRSGELIYFRLNPGNDEPEPTDYTTIPLTFGIISGGTIVWKASSSAYAKTIEYKKNNGNWTSITSSTGGTSISVNAGDKVQFRGDNTTYASGGSAYNTFSGTTARFNLYGNIMSLLDSTGFTTATLTDYYTFLNLFLGCTGLVFAENLKLSADTLTNVCYGGMFYGCTSLTTAPELPAMALAGSCYDSMFAGCTSLTAAPILPAQYLYNNCYNSMFYNCNNLNYVKCLANGWSIQATPTPNWLYGVASNGTFVKNASMTRWESGASGIPSNWTVQNA